MSSVRLPTGNIQGSKFRAVGINDIEVVWHDLKAHHLAYQTFTDIAALDQAIHTGVEALNRERMVDPLAKARISV